MTKLNRIKKRRMDYLNIENLYISTFYTIFAIKYRETRENRVLSRNCEGGFFFL